MIASAKNTVSIAGFVSPSPFVQPVSRIEKYRFSVLGNLVTNTAGNIFTAIVIDPSVSLEWSSISQLYGEFRIVGGQFTVTPTVQPTTTSVSGLIVAYNNSSITAPNAPNEILALSTRTIYSLGKDSSSTGLIYTWKVPVVGTATSIIWQKPTGFSSGASIQIANMASVSAAASIASYVVDYYVEFRTRV